MEHNSSTVVDVVDLPGTIHPFFKTDRSLLETLSNELKILTQERQAKKLFVVAGANLLATIMLLFWCNSTNSMALTAYTYLTIFDIFSLMTCLVSYWVQKQQPSPIFSFGYERFEVLAVFASTVLAQLGCLFIVKESVERMVEQPDIHTGRLLLGTILALCFHLFITYTIENKAFNHVISASGSSWLQEHVADMSQSLCYALPGLSKVLLPRINPFSLIGVAGCIALIVTYLMIDVYTYHAMDTWAALWIALMTAGTMFPMSVYSGKILLQTTPSHIIGQLDKSLREASTLDGVLEFRNEHFWTISFGTMAGSVHVRIRRDADEQLVLAHVMNRLCNVVSLMTVQVFKDDWIRTSAYQAMRDTSMSSPQHTTESILSMGSNLAAKFSSGLSDTYITSTNLEAKNIAPPPISNPKSSGLGSAPKQPLSQRNLYSTPSVLSTASSNRFHSEQHGMENNFPLSSTHETLTAPPQNPTAPSSVQTLPKQEAQHDINTSNSNK